MNYLLKPRRFRPTTRYFATAANCMFPTQIGKVIYTTVDRDVRTLTWRNARGFTFWSGRRIFYVPIFFWRGVA